METKIFPSPGTSGRSVKLTTHFHLLSKSEECGSRFHVPFTRLWRFGNIWSNFSSQSQYHRSCGVVVRNSSRPTVYCSIIFADCIDITTFITFLYKLAHRHKTDPLTSGSRFIPNADCETIP